MSLDELVRRFTQDRSDGDQMLRDFISGAAQTTNRRPGPLVIPTNHGGGRASDSEASAAIAKETTTYDDSREVSNVSEMPSAASSGPAPAVSPEDIASHMRSRPSLRRLMSNTPTSSFSGVEPDSPVSSPRSPMRTRTGSTDSVFGNERLLDRARAKDVFDKVAETHGRAHANAKGEPMLDAEGVCEAWRILGLKKAMADVESFVDEFSYHSFLATVREIQIEFDGEAADGSGGGGGGNGGGGGDKCLTFDQFSDGMFALEERGLFSFRKGSSTTETHAERIENVRRKRRVSVKPAEVQAEKVQETMLKMRSPDRSLSRSLSAKHRAKFSFSAVFTLWGPEDAYIIGFDFLVTLVLLTTIISMPLCLAFEEINTAMFWPNFLTDCIFICDIVKNFNTGFRDEDDVLVMNRRRVNNAYLKGWFIPDLFSSLPMDAALKWSDADSGPGAQLARSTKLIKMLRLVRLAKVFRLMKASKVFHMLRSGLTELEDKLKIKVSEGTLKLYRLGLILVIVAHWMGCINYMIVRMYSFPSGSWADNLQLTGDDDASLAKKYQWAMLKAFLTLILLEPTYATWCNPVGDETDEDWCRIEWWINTVFYYVGAVFYSLLISSISSILLSMNIASQAFEEKMAQVNEYMRAKRLPIELRDNIREFYAEKYKDGKMFDEASMHAEMTPALRQKILHHEMRHVLIKVPVLRDGPQTLPVKFSPFLTLEVHLEGDVVIEEGGMAESMYFIANGELGISCKGYAPSPDASPVSASSPTSSSDDMNFLKFVFEGCYVGEVALLLDSSKNPSAFDDKGSEISVSRRTATLTVVSTTCVLYALKGTDLIHIIQEYPEVKLYMENAALGRYERVTERKMNQYEDQEDAKTAEYQNRAAAFQEMEESLSPTSRRKFMSKSFFSSNQRGSTASSRGSTASSRGSVTTPRVITDSQRKSSNTIELAPFPSGAAGTGTGT